VCLPQRALYGCRFAGDHRKKPSRAAPLGERLPCSHCSTLRLLKPKLRATGRCEGRKPYGTRPGEADVVARIHKLRRKPRGGERLSFKAIATG
jgi:hypothetical protein